MKAILLFVVFGLIPIEAAETFNNATPKIPLSMVPSSVDDKYLRCTEKMSESVQKKYFPKEIKDRLFATVWKNAEKCLKKSLQIRPKQDRKLTENHLQAICLYTAGGKYNFYKKFNDLVLTSAGVYTSSFPYHAVHFWLTTAVQILRENNKTCHETFRRTTAHFSGRINQTIRFGSFTSSSFRSDLYNFGKETCFSIKTCSGAFLKDYPTQRSKEQEVLIPPYEKFKIVNKTKRSRKTDCRTTFELQSVGDESNHNCEAV